MKTLRLHLIFYKKSIACVLALLHVLTPQLSRAENLTCNQLLSDTSFDAIQTVKRPLLGNRINPVGLRRWVEAHRAFGPDFYELADFIAMNINMVTQAEFEAYLLTALNDFLSGLEEDQAYFIVVTEEPGKSQFWVANLITEISRLRPPASVLTVSSNTEISEYLLENPNQIPIFVDDAMYTGQSMEEGIRTYLSNAYMQNNPINIVLAATTLYAKNTLERNENFKVFFGLMMTSVGELLNQITDEDKRSRLLSAFNQQYSDYSLDLPITGFAHMTADMASIPGMSSDEDYLHVSPQEQGTTILEGVLMGPDQRVRGTIPILDTEEKPY
jgi:hypothetical protein